MMETRTLVEKVSMLKIFWETQVELIMKLKPTTVLDEKDIVTLKEMASGAGQGVGIQSTDALDVWTSWTAQYMGLMKLRQEEVENPLHEMLFDDIHGIRIPLETNPNEEPGTLPSHESALGPESQ